MGASEACCLDHSGKSVTEFAAAARAGEEPAGGAQEDLWWVELRDALEPLRRAHEEEDRRVDEGKREAGRLLFRQQLREELRDQYSQGDREGAHVFAADAPGGSLAGGACPEVCPEGNSVPSEPEVCPEQSGAESSSSRRHRATGDPDGLGPRKALWFAAAATLSRAAVEEDALPHLEVHGSAQLRLNGRYAPLGHRHDGREVWGMSDLRLFYSTKNRKWYISDALEDVGWEKSEVTDAVLPVGLRWGDAVGVDLAAAGEAAGAAARPPPGAPPGAPAAASPQARRAAFPALAAASRPLDPASPSWNAARTGVASSAAMPGGRGAWTSPASTQVRANGVERDGGCLSKEAVVSRHPNTGEAFADALMDDVGLWEMLMDSPRAVKLLQPPFWPPAAAPAEAARLGTRQDPEPVASDRSFDDGLVKVRRRSGVVDGNELLVNIAPRTPPGDPAHRPQEGPWDQLGEGPKCCLVAEGNLAEGSTPSTRMWDV